MNDVGILNNGEMHLTQVICIPIIFYHFPIITLFTNKVYFILWEKLQGSA